MDYAPGRSETTSDGDPDKLTKRKERELLTTISPKISEIPINPDRHHLKQIYFN